MSTDILDDRRPSNSDDFPGERKGKETLNVDDPFLVMFDIDDPENPKNWSSKKRWVLTFVAGTFILSSTFASSSPSGIVQHMIDKFHFSHLIATLTISLFVCGYVLGPLVWAPLSEQYGRKPFFIASFTVYTLCQVGSALAPNTAALLVFRFLGGCFAANPITNSGAFISDIWDARERGKAMAIFCVAPFIGPTLGPLVAGFIEVSNISFRWLYWVLACFAGSCLFVIIFFIPETYAPVILVRKARRIREESGDSRYYAPLEALRIPFKTRLKRILAKPFLLFLHEPMLVAMTVYVSFVYGCIYILFEAYPIVFGEEHHMNAGSTGLMFLPILTGCVTAGILYRTVFQPIYESDLEKYSPDKPPPEVRLKSAMYSGPFYVISFFWFGWTSYPFISYWASMSSGVFLGVSISLIFVALTNYIVDAYLSVAASALAVYTVIRSAAGAGFPLFARAMYDKLGPRWASTVLGVVALFLAPIPLVLHKYGETLRKRSRYVANI